MKKGFSVAEAMMALLIGSVALGAAAPMITKQIKQNNFADAQLNVINRQMQNTNEEIERNKSVLDNKVNDALTEIDKKMESLDIIPSGAVMYFDLDKCPDNWTPLVQKYPAASNAFIRNISGSGRDLGSYQASAVPNIKGWFHALDLVATYNGPFYDTGNGRVVSGYGKQGDYYYRQQGMDLNKVSNVYQDGVAEARPANIALLACIKN